MKIICIDNIFYTQEDVEFCNKAVNKSPNNYKPFPNPLTKNKIYEAFTDAEIIEYGCNIDSDSYYLRGDDGRIWHFWKSLFITIEQQREDKINYIID